MLNFVWLQQQRSTSPPRASTTPPLPATTTTPPFDSIKLSAVDISESVNKQLSNIRNQQSTGTASAMQAAENSDPRYVTK
jgi:hypothetical protein